MISKADGAFGDYELNEVSVLAVKAKKDKDLLPELWHYTYRLVIRKCSDFWNGNETVKARCEFDDLIQESYLQFYKAVQDYQPDRGAQFMTFMDYAIKTACTLVTGGRTKRQRNDPFFHAGSLDAPIKEDEDTTVGEIIPDPNATADFIGVEEDDAVRLILDQVEKIKDPCDRYLFREYAYKCRSQAELARDMHVSQAAVQHRIERAAQQLRLNPIIKNTYHQFYEKTQYYISDGAHKGVTAFFNSGTSIVEDIVFRKLTIDQKYEKDQKKAGKISHEKNKDNESSQ